MKFIFSLLIFLAVSAISADIVVKFIDSSEVIAASSQACEDPSDNDSDNPLKDPTDDDDDEEFKEKELYFESFKFVPLSVETRVNTGMNTHIAFFIEHPLQATPFSPPELA